MIYLELGDLLAISCEVLGLEVDALVHVTDQRCPRTESSKGRSVIEGYHRRIKENVIRELYEEGMRPQ